MWAGTRGARQLRGAGVSSPRHIRCTTSWRRAVRTWCARWPKRTGPSPCKFRQSPTSCRGRTTDQSRLFAASAQASSADQSSSFTSFPSHRQNRGCACATKTQRRYFQQRHCTRIVESHHHHNHHQQLLDRHQLDRSRLPSTCVMRSCEALPQARSISDMMLYPSSSEDDRCEPYVLVAQASHRAARTPTGPCLDDGPRDNGHTPATNSIARRSNKAIVAAEMVASGSSIDRVQPRRWRLDDLANSSCVTGHGNFGRLLT